MPAPSQLPPLDPDHWSDALAPMRDGFARQLNIYKVMAHHPALLTGWAGLRDHLVTRNALGPVLLEVAILRVAARLRSGYEWSHHVHRAGKAGLSDARVQSIAGDVAGMEPADRIIARAVDATLDDSAFDRPLLSELTGLVGTTGVMDLIAVVGFYKILGTIAAIYDVPLDADVPEAPLP